MEINEKTKVIDLIENCKAMESFFTDRGMYCRTCKGRINCTLRKVAFYYGLLPVEDFIKKVTEYYKRSCLKPKVIKKG